MSRPPPRSPPAAPAAGSPAAALSQPAASPDTSSPVPPPSPALHSPPHASPAETPPALQSSSALLFSSFLSLLRLLLLLLPLRFLPPLGPLLQPTLHNSSTRPPAAGSSPTPLRRARRTLLPLQSLHVLYHLAPQRSSCPKKKEMSFASFFGGFLVLKSSKAC